MVKNYNKGKKCIAIKEFHYSIAKAIALKEKKTVKKLIEDMLYNKTNLEEIRELKDVN